MPRVPPSLACLERQRARGGDLNDLRTLMRVMCVCVCVSARACARARKSARASSPVRHGVRSEELALLRWPGRHLHSKKSPRASSPERRHAERARECTSGVGRQVREATVHLVGTPHTYISVLSLEGGLERLGSY